MYNEKKLSIIVPVYRLEKEISKNLKRMKTKISAFIPNYEIIVVVDGTIDHSYEEAKKVSGIKVFGYRKNQGKGYALKYGFYKSHGELVTFMDADTDIDPSQLRLFYNHLSSSDLIIGNKRHPFSKVKYPLNRRLISLGYSIMIRMLFGMKIHDTQTGIKLFKREVLEVILPMVLVKRFAFDLELCFLAHKHGFRIVEAPVNIRKGFSKSTVKFSDITSVFLDTLAIWYRYHIKKYYQHKFYEEFYR